MRICIFYLRSTLLCIVFFLIFMFKLRFDTLLINENDDDDDDDDNETCYMQKNILMFYMHVNFKQKDCILLMIKNI